MIEVTTRSVLPVLILLLVGLFAGAAAEALRCYLAPGRCTQTEGCSR